MKIGSNPPAAAVSPAGPPAPSERAGGQSPLRSPLQPGQPVRGEVVVRLSDQVYLVRINGELHRADLPLELKPGTPLELTFRGADPRPTFTLSGAASDAAPVKLGSLASWLHSVAREGAGTRQLPPRLYPPLIDASPGDPPLLAEALRNGLARSGLFYESHLLQWVLGKMSLAEILKEPQSRLSRQGVTDTGRKATGAPLSELLFDEPESDATGPASGRSAETASDGVHGLPASTTDALVREQLSLLMTGILRWRGAVWGEQDMEWEIERDADGAGAGDEKAWRTNLRLRLPRLGQVDATLTLSDGGIRGKLTYDAAATGELMNRELDTLAERMSEAGLRIDGMVVERETEG